MTWEDYPEQPDAPLLLLLRDLHQIAGTAPSDLAVRTDVPYNGSGPAQRELPGPWTTLTAGAPS